MFKLKGQVMGQSLSPNNDGKIRNAIILENGAGFFVDSDKGDMELEDALTIMIEKEDHPQPRSTPVAPPRESPPQPQHHPRKHRG